MKKNKKKQIKNRNKSTFDLRMEAALKWQQSKTSRDVKISRGAKKMIKELSKQGIDVDVDQIKGSGYCGNILKDDITFYVSSNNL